MGFVSTGDISPEASPVSDRGPLAVGSQSQALPLSAMKQLIKQVVRRVTAPLSPKGLCHSLTR